MNLLIDKTVNALKKKKLKVAFAESCTGGMLSGAITSVGGSSKVFVMSIVAYSNRSKINVLKVPKRTIAKYGAVSKECCAAMLRGLCKITKSNIYLSITGIAGPDGNSKTKPIGLVYIGLKKGDKIKIHKYLFSNKSRSYIQKIAIKKSLELILNFIE